MYPMKKDCQEYILIRFKDVKNDHLIRSFFTQEPWKYLQMFEYMTNHDISFDIGEDFENENDPYNDMVADIEDIIVTFGGKDTFPCIDVWVEVRDFR